MVISGLINLSVSHHSGSKGAGGKGKKNWRERKKKLSLIGVFFGRCLHQQKETLHLLNHGQLPIPTRYSLVKEKPVHRPSDVGFLPERSERSVWTRSIVWGGAFNKAQIFRNLFCVVEVDKFFADIKVVGHVVRDGRAVELFSCRLERLVRR